MIHWMIFGIIKNSSQFLYQGVDMKNTLFLLIIFGLLIGSAGNVHAWDGDAGKSSDASSKIP